MKMYIGYYGLTLLLLTFWGCSDSQGEASVNYATQIRITLSEERVSVGGAGAEFRVELTLSDTQYLSCIAVRRWKGGSVDARLSNIEKNSIQNNRYLYSYTLNEEDLKGGQLQFQFVPVDIHDNYGNEYLLTVDIEEQRMTLRPVRSYKVARMTGATESGETLPNPNLTHERYNIGGSDLGIFWRMGGDKVGIFFGDTYGRGWRPGVTPDWRSNVLAFSTDILLDDGITFDSMVCDQRGEAREVIYSAHDTSGYGDYSSIPTAGIRIGTSDYVHYMNVRAWHPNWVTNWSGYAVSEDDGESWQLHTGLFAAGSRFAQVALWQQEEWVYAIGSIIGRRGLPYLARFYPENILSPSSYEYWNATEGWMAGNENTSTPLFGNYADEMYAEPTLVYHDFYNKWITVYYNEIKNQIVMRDADAVTGPWSDEKVIARGTEYPQPYGGFIYPLHLDGPQMYIALSQWDPLYNVFLMKVELEEVKE